MGITLRRSGRSRIGLKESTLKCDIDATKGSADPMWALESRRAFEMTYMIHSAWAIVLPGQPASGCSLALHKEHKFTWGNQKANAWEETQLWDSRGHSSGSRGNQGLCLDKGWVFQVHHNIYCTTYATETGKTCRESLLLKSVHQDARPAFW